MIDQSLLEFSIREQLNKIAPRVAAVLDPIKLTVTNYPAGEVEWNDAINNPEDETAGTHPVPFTRNLLVEREDFMEESPEQVFPPLSWSRSAPKERLRGGLHRLRQGCGR